MVRSVLLSAAACLLSACAVDIAEFEAPASAAFAPVETPIPGTFALTIANPEALAIKTEALGVTCSAVKISGDFNDRTQETGNNAFTALFSGQQDKGTYQISLTPQPSEPRVLILRRGYVVGDARVDFGIGGTFHVVAPDGSKYDIVVDETDVHIRETYEGAYGCDGAARAFNEAGSTSIDQLFSRASDELRSEVMGPE